MATTLVIGTEAFLQGKSMHPGSIFPDKPKVEIGKRWAGGLMRVKHNRATGVYEHMAPEITGDMELLQRCLCPAKKQWIKDPQ